MRGSALTGLIAAMMTATPALAAPDAPTPASPALAAEFEGEGQVPIVGGNLVSARRRALRQAQRDAVVRAVESIVPPERRPESRPAGPLDSRIYRRHLRYLRRYRVLSEEQQGARFAIKIAATLNLKRLRREIAATLGGAGSAATAPRIAVVVGLTLRPSSPALRQQLTRLVGARLRQHGFDVAAASAPATASRRLRLTGVISVQPAAGVRGIALPGAQADAALEVDALPRATRARAQARRWGIGGSRGAAEASAAQRAAEAALARLVPLLQERWPAALTRPGQRLIHIANVAAPRQLAALRATLAERVPGVRSARMRRIARGEVVFVVEAAVSMTSAKLAAALSKQTFEGFKLETNRVEGGASWLALVTTP